MLQGLFFKWILKAIFNAIQKKRQWREMEDYVKKPNELDKQMKQVQKNYAKLGKDNEEMQKEIAILRKASHPPIFSEKDKKKIWKSIKKLEKKNG